MTNLNQSFFFSLKNIAAMALLNVLLVVSFAFVGCTVTRLDMKEETYSLKIEDAEHDVVKSILQQKRIATALSKPDSIIFTRTSLKSILVSLLGKDQTLIQCDDSLKINRKINLAFRSFVKNDSVQVKKNKELIIKHLSEVYHFKLSEKMELQDVWTLHTQELASLLKHQNSNRGEAEILTKVLKSIESKASTFAEITTALGAEYNERIIDSTHTTGYFDLFIERKTFEELQQQLVPYGLSLRKMTNMQPYTVVAFVAKKTDGA